MIRVLIADDQEIVRTGLRMILDAQQDVEVVAEAEDGPSALAAIKAHRPQVALLDHQMPGMDGGQIAAAVLREELPTRVLLVSAHADSALVYHALQQGAAGYLPKESSRSEIITAVLDCAAGRDVLDPKIASGLAAEIRRRAEPSGPTLSAREREVLKLIADGGSIPMIAKTLFLAPSTVKTHVQRLYEKLGVGDRAAAVAEAMRRGLLE